MEVRRWFLFSTFDLSWKLSTAVRLDTLLVRKFKQNIVYALVCD